MLDMAIASCRDPEPADVGEELETIGIGAVGGRRAARQRGRRTPGDRPRLPIQRARRDRAGRRLVSPPALAPPPGGGGRPRSDPPGPPARRSPPASAAARAHPQTALERLLATSSDSPASRPGGDQRPGGPRRAPRRARAAARSAGCRPHRAPARRLGACGERAAGRPRRSAWRTSSSTPLAVAFSTRRLHAQGVVVERDDGRVAELARPRSRARPSRSRRRAGAPRAGPRRTAPAAAADTAWWSRERRCRRPDRGRSRPPGARGRRPRTAPTGAGTRIAGISGRPGVGGGGATSTGRWKLRQRSLQSSATSVVWMSTSAPPEPAAAFSSGRLGSSPGAP